MVVGGGTLFLYGLTRSAPTACLLGTAGLALAAEGVVNASVEDIAQLPDRAADFAGSAVESLGGEAQESGSSQGAPAPMVTGL
jgi:hypothetical protein